MCHYEQLWLRDCPPEFKPLLYRRYVDDTFLLFNDASHIERFLTYLNSRHPSIHFTCEIEKNGTLPFLDIAVSRGSSFSTSIYRKPTFTGLYTNFQSFVPDKFKLNIVEILVHRICQLTSTYEGMHTQLETIKEILLKNGYPLKLIQNKVKYVVARLVSSQPKPAIHTCAKKRIFISLPYTGKHGLVIKNKLLKLFRRHYPQIDLRVIFKPSFRVSDLFHFKDRIPRDVRSSVVYQFSCGSCNATYIGMTARHFRQRVCEHRGISSRTGRYLQVRVHSAVREHCELTGHPLFSDNFKIIVSAQTPSDLPILEDLAIVTRKPSLNTQFSTRDYRLYC